MPRTYTVKATPEVMAKSQAVTLKQYRVDVDLSGDLSFATFMHVMREIYDREHGHKITVTVSVLQPGAPFRPAPPDTEGDDDLPA
jgi:hypothetical protein